MTINAHTKIATLLKYHPEALEAIVSLSPDFKKLRNPVLRRIMAGRTSISMAAKIGGCKPEDFFAKLAPLGFNVDDSPSQVIEPERKSLPPYLQSIQQKQIVCLDVRTMLSEGRDPLNLILQTVKKLQPGEVMKIINTFEPTPLINVLQKQGFDSYVDPSNDKLIETYFFKTQPSVSPGVGPAIDHSTDWEHILKRFEERLQSIDVRELEMPMPMMTILEALNRLPDEKALYVYHKRIPVFLLTELRERNFDYRIKELSDHDVHLIIFKN